MEDRTTSSAVSYGAEHRRAVDSLQRPADQRGVIDAHDVVNA